MILLSVQPVLGPWILQVKAQSSVAAFDLHLFRETWASNLTDEILLIQSVHSGMSKKDCPFGTVPVRIHPNEDAWEVWNLEVMRHLYFGGKN